MGFAADMYSIGASKVVLIVGCSNPNNNPKLCFLSGSEAILVLGIMSIRWHAAATTSSSSSKDSSPMTKVEG